ncbi:hypothetical protein CBR_g12334 [Chara braunii]|uniref:Uncharacterized protein n=1 Tax=Chara braunii TaxID=69332 RepID=A0A388KRU6_CHABU|nr:hypothetical protein CBR_g12334 [Chara braunii]|eukprot:GBG72766.1 hypothetical protein CBR_g12334 [Chara braunii]
MAGRLGWTGDPDGGGRGGGGGGGHPDGGGGGGGREGEGGDGLDGGGGGEGGGGGGGPDGGGGGGGGRIDGGGGGGGGGPDGGGPDGGGPDGGGVCGGGRRWRAEIGGCKRRRAAKGLVGVQVTWTQTSEQPACIEYLELLILQAWRTDVEGDLLGFLFGSERLDHRQPITRELVVPLVQLADDLSLDIVSQSDDSPAPHIISRALAPYLQWTACLEEPGSDSTLPSRQEYLKPYGIIDRAFYPKEPEEALEGEEEATEEEGDANEETSEEGSYSEYSEGEQSEEEVKVEEKKEEDEEEEAGSEWEDLPEEAARTGTEAEDLDAARRREEIADVKNQLEIASEASLYINDDPTRDPEPPEPEDGGSATAAPSASRRRRSRSPSPSTPTRPPVRPRTDAGDRPSSPVIIPPSP